MIGDETQLIAGLASGLSLKKAAAAAGMSEATAKRRRRDPDIIRQLSELKQQRQRSVLEATEARWALRDDALDNLLKLQSLAVEWLSTLPHNDSPQVQMQAIRIVLNAAAGLEDRMICGIAS